MVSNLALIEPNDLFVNSTANSSILNTMNPTANDFLGPQSFPAGVPMAMPASIPFPMLCNLEVDIKINYHGTHELEQVTYGNWIDLYLAEDYDLEPREFKLLSLGISMELPEGFEANIVPRSSTFKNYGILQTNHFAVIDSSFSGDEDIWHFPAYATRKVHLDKNIRICQFRINQIQPRITFKSVESLGNINRGGFGEHSGK